MNKTYSAWERYIFILFKILKNNFQDIKNVHRKSFLTKDFEILGLSYVSLFDRSDSSGTYESIIQNRLQNLTKDKVLTNIKGTGVYGISSEETLKKMNDVLGETKEHFKSLDSVIFQKNFELFEQNDKQFAKSIANINYTYKFFIKNKILEKSEHIENINKLEHWIGISKSDPTLCKQEIAFALIQMVEDGINILLKMKYETLIPKLEKQKKYLQKIILQPGSIL